MKNVNKAHAGHPPHVTRELVRGMHYFGRGKGERLLEKLIAQQERDRAAVQPTLPKKKKELSEAPADLKAAATSTDQSPTISKPTSDRGGLIERLFRFGAGAAAVVTAFLVLVGISRDTGQAQTKGQKAKDKTEAKAENLQTGADEKKSDEKGVTSTTTEIRSTPMRVVLATGSNGIAFIEAGKGGSVDLTKLGVKNFDGNELDVPVKVNGVGWMHYVLNKNWTGILIIVEPKDGASKAVGYPVETNDGSKTINPTSGKFDTDGLFAVPTQKGLILVTLDAEGYIPLEKEFGVSALENPTLKIEVDGKTGKKYVVISVSNSTEKRKVDVTTGAVEKVIKKRQINTETGAVEKTFNSVPPETLLWRERADSSCPHPLRDVFVVPSQGHMPPITRITPRQSFSRKRPHLCQPPTPVVGSRVAVSACCQTRVPDSTGRNYTSRP
jgi:hypothetical protein